MSLVSSHQEVASQLPLGNLKIFLFHFTVSSYASPAVKTADGCITVDSCGLSGDFLLICVRFISLTLLSGIMEGARFALVASVLNLEDNESATESTSLFIKIVEFTTTTETKDLLGLTFNSSVGCDCESGSANLSEEICDFLSSPG